MDASFVNCEWIREGIAVEFQAIFESLLELKPLVEKGYLLQWVSFLCAALFTRSEL